jgi:hypothetical protein
MDISVTPIDGINEKLKRAHENIINLDSEITTFFNENKSPIVGDEDLDVLYQKAEYLGKLPVPLRFSVLSGEILHHFRSCLDHMAWLLAVPEIRRKRPLSISFPVLCERFHKDGSPSIKGKIEIFANPDVQKIVEQVQPYNTRDPLNDRLWIIHDLDRKAKHRELPLTFTGFDAGSPILNVIGNFYAANPNALMSSNLARQFKQKMKLAPLVLIADVTKGQPQPLIATLHQLKGEVEFTLALLLEHLALC